MLALPQATFSLQFPQHLNVFTSVITEAATGEQPESTDHYQILSFSTKDAFRVSQLDICSIKVDGMKVLFENEEFLCLMADQFNQTEAFGKKAYDVFRQVKATMVGDYFPAEYPVQQVTLVGSGKYPSADRRVINIDESVIREFDVLTLTHEMVHAVDQSVESFGKVPPPA